MRRSARSERIDYKVLNQTGQRVLQQSNQSLGGQPSTQDVLLFFQDVLPSAQEVQPLTQDVLPSTQEVQPLTQDVLPSTQEVQPFTQDVLPSTQRVISNDIRDLISETEVGDLNQVQLDSLLSKFESLYRTTFRTLHTELQITLAEDEYEKHFYKVYNNTMNSIRDFIKELRIHMKMLRHDAEQRECYRNQAFINSKRFILAEVKTAIKPLQTFFNQAPSNLTYDELIIAQGLSQSNLKKLNFLSNNVKDLLSNPCVSQDDDDEVPGVPQKSIGV